MHGYIRYSTGHIRWFFLEGTTTWNLLGGESRMDDWWEYFFCIWQRLVWLWVHAGLSKWLLWMLVERLRRNECARGRVCCDVELCVLCAWMNGSRPFFQGTAPSGIHIRKRQWIIVVYRDTTICWNWATIRQPSWMMVRQSWRWRLPLVHPISDSGSNRSIVDTF